MNLVTLLAAFGTGGLAVIAAVLGSAEFVAAFGLGNLAGSLLVTARPLRGEPARMAVLGAAGLAAALGLAAVAPHPATFALAGFANAPFFTATLAARARYAPPEAHAQVFVSMAGLKIAAASAGAAVAGATIATAGPRALLAAGAVVTLLGALTARGRHSLQACPSSPRPNAPGGSSSARSAARSSPSTIATPTSAGRTRPVRSRRRCRAAADGGAPAGKLLWVETDNGGPDLGLHLGMAGRITVDEADAPRVGTASRSSSPAAGGWRCGTSGGSAAR